MIVYLVTNQANGKQYVGQTTSSLHRRWTKHCQSASSINQRHYKLSRAIVKYGIDSFKVEPLHMCENTEEMSFVEMFYIALLDSIKKGYNITQGGEGANGYRHTPESKAKMHAAQLGNKKGTGAISPYQKQRIRETWLGRKHTAETKAKIKAAALLRTRERNEKGQYF